MPKSTDATRDLVAPGGDLHSARRPVPAATTYARSGPALIFTFSVLLTACGGRALSKNSAQELVAGLLHDTLDKEDVYIESVSQTGERDAIVEARLKTAFRFERIGGKWVIKEVRVDRNQWENLDDFMRAMTVVKTEETRELLDRVAKAIERYRDKNGKLPSFTDFVSLTNVLSPDYLTPLVRLDAWRRPLNAGKLGPETVTLTSAGPDGRFGTPDDIVLRRSF